MITANKFILFTILLALLGGVIWFWSDFNQMNYKKLKSGVYTGQNGTIYFKVYNNAVHHPANSGYHDFAYHKQIYDYKTKQWILLNQLVDKNTISRINYSGAYFQDHNYYYIFPAITARGEHYPQYVQRNKGKIVGNKSQYLFTNEAVFEYGVALEDLDRASAKYVHYKAKNNKILEYISDNHHLYLFARRLSLNSFCFTDLNRSLKEKLIHRFYKGNKANMRYCDELKVIVGGE